MRPDDAIWKRIHAHEYVGPDLDRSILLWSSVIPIGLLLLFAVGIVFTVGAPPIPEGMALP
jgi:hypothetical protein